MMNRKILWMMLAAVSGLAGSARAALFTYDADGATAGAQDGAGSGWNTTSTTAFWNGTANVAWGNASTDTAAFGAGSGTAGTVTVGTVNVGDISFNATGSGNYTLSSGTITLGGTHTITTNTNAAIGSVITGSSGLIKAGTSTLTLSGVNTYTGTTTVNAGVLDASLKSSISGTLAIGAAGQFNSNAVDDYASSYTLTGDGIYNQKSGSSSQSFTNFTGTVALNGGTYRVNSSWDGHFDLLVNSGTVNPYNGGMLQVKVKSLSGTGGVVSLGIIASNSCLYIMGNTNNTTYSGAITGSTGNQLFKSGTGTQTLSGANTYSGGTTIGAGTIIAGSSGALGSGGTVTMNDASTGTNATSLLIGYSSGTISRAITVANLGTGTVTLGTNFSGGVDYTFSGAIALNRDVTLYNGNASSDKLAFSGVISGTGNINVGGVSSARVSFLQTGANNTFVGNVNVSGTSRLQLGAGNGAADMIYDGAIVTVASGGGFHLGKGSQNETIGALSGSGSVQAVWGNDILTVGGNNMSGAFSGVMSQTGGNTLALTKTGTGTQTLSGSNTHTGLTTVSAGTLAYGTSNALGSGAVTVDGATATLSLGGYSDTVGAVTLKNGGAITGTGGVLTGSSYAVESGTISAILGGAIALTKSTSGTITLSGINTYSGATSVNAGVLNITGSLASGSAVAVASGTTLSGTGTVGGTVTVATGTGAITAGNGITGQLTIGNLIFSGTGTINIGTLTGYTATPALNVTGNLTLSGGAGSVTLALPVSLLSNATYHLVGHGNSLASLTGFTVTGPSLGARQTGTLTNNTNMIDYVVAGDSPYWTGANSTEWSGGNNWKLITADTVTDYIAGDIVLFNDNATTTVVNVGANVAPNGVAFNNSTKDYTLQGAYAITSGILQKSGTGSLTINNSNSFTGGSTLGGGTVTMGTATALGSGSIALNAGTLDINGQSIANAIVLGGGAVTGSGTISGVISGAGALSKGGSGTLALSNSNSYSGGTTITAGTLNVNNANALGNASGALTFNAADATLQLGATIASSARNYVMTQTGTIDTNGYSLANSGIISGNGGLIKAGAGTLTLSGSSGYSGGTTINAGTLNVNNANALGNASGALTFNGTGATLQLGATIAASTRNYVMTQAGTIDTNGYNLVNSGAVSGAGGLTKIGTGTLTLSGANGSYTGKTTITAGVLSIAADSGLGAAPGTVTADQLTLNGGSLVVSATGQTLATNRGITLGAAGGKIDISSLGVNGTLTVNSKITGTGALTLAGAGDTSASGGANTYLGIDLINTGNDFIGDVTITAGLVSYASNSAFGNSANKIILNGGGLLDNNAGVALSRDIQVLAGGGYIRTYTTAVTISGALTGSGALNRTDAGALTLSGDLSAYTGTFNNQQSTTTMSNKIVGGALTVTGGTLNLNGTGTAGAVTINGGTLSVGAANTVGTITNNGGALSVGATGNLTAGAIANFSTSCSLSVAAGGVLSASSYTAAYNPSSFAVNGTMNLTGLLTLSTASTWGISGTGTINAAGYVNQNYTNITFNAQRLNLGGSGIANGASNGNSITFNGTTIGAYADWSSSLGLTLTGSNTFNTLDSKDSATARTVALSGVLSGAGSLTKTGTGTLTLSGTNTYSGGTTVTNGVLTAGNAAALGTGAVTLNGGTLDINSYNVANAIVLSGGTLAGYDNSTLSGIFSGTGGLVKSGTGTLTLSGSNAYTGGTAISNGKVVLGANTGLGTNTVTLSGGTLDINSKSVANAIALSGGMLTGDGTLSGVVSGTGSLTKTTSGTLTLSAINTYTGGTTVNAGTLNLNNGGSGGAIRGTVTVNGGAVLRLAYGDALGYFSDVTAVSTINLVGGTLTSAAGANQTTTAKIYMTGGAINGTINLDLYSNTSSVTTYASASESTISVTTMRLRQNDTVFTVADGAAARDLVISSSIGNGAEGNHNIIKTGAGTMVLTGSNTFTGSVTVNNGTLAAGNDAAFGTGSVALNGGTLDLGGHAIANNIVLGGGALSFSGATISGNISETGGAKALTVGANLTLSGSNSYSGGTTVNAGTLTAGTVNAFGSGAVTVSGGTLSLGGLAVTNAIDFQSGSLTNVGGAATTNVKSGAILNSNGLTIGGTTNVLAGGKLTGTGALGILNVAGTLAPGNSPGITTARATLWDATGKYEWEINDTAGIAGNEPSGFDQLQVTGALTINSGFKLKLISLNSLNEAGTPANWDPMTTYSWTIATATGGITGVSNIAIDANGWTAGVGPGGNNWSLSTAGVGNTSLVLTYVPEPGTLGLLAIGALALLGRRRNRRG